MMAGRVTGGLGFFVDAVDVVTGTVITEVISRWASQKLTASYINIHLPSPTVVFHA